MDPRLVDDASAVRGLRDLLEALHERVPSTPRCCFDLAPHSLNFIDESTSQPRYSAAGRDRHPREALSATVRALLRVTAETSDQRQVQVELLDEPLNARAGLVAHYLRGCLARMRRSFAR